MSKITGIDILIHVNVGTEGAPEWKPVGGQRGASLSESRDIIELHSKTSPGSYKEKEYSWGDWSISCDGVYIENEEAYAHLVRAMREKKKVMVRWAEAGLGTIEGQAVVASRDLDGPYDGEATYSMELQGHGDPEPVENYSNNLSDLTGIEEEGAAALDFVPEFAAEVYAYVVNVDSASTWIKLTPTATEGVIKVNGNVVPTATESAQIPLGDAGSLTDVAVSVQESGKMARVYKITVVRGGAV